MRKLLILTLALTSIISLQSRADTILINGTPVNHLYVDSEGRLYLTPGPGRKPVEIKIPSRSVETHILSSERRIKVGGEAYLHYDADLKSPSHSNAFKITRNYIEFRGYFNDRDYFRTTLDVHQAKAKNGDKAGDLDGSYIARIKYAYVYFHNVLPHTGVEIGLAHRPWHDWEEHHGWLHRDVEETLIENKEGAGLENSADLGVSFKGKYSIASWQFGIFNGEGYHGEEDSEHFGKSLEGRLSLNLFRGFMLSGHTAHIFDLKGQDMDRHIYQVHAVYNNPYFLVAAQYIWDRDDYYNKDDLDQKGYSFNADLKLKPFTGYSVGILGRYDHWDPNDDKSNDEREHFVYGAWWDYSKYVRFTVVDDRLIDNAGKDKNTLMAVTKVKW
ncbi:MAG: hypothetical protein DSZ26_03455 [Thermovibrio sp.]|nr:MAG: hypothetical protein DSZ26_03455 [Thermovibrio sp.]